MLHYTTLAETANPVGLSARSLYALKLLKTSIPHSFNFRKAEKTMYTMR